MRERHTFIAIALLSLLSVAAAAQDQDGYDFRKTRWGMSVAQVKASETNNLLTQSSNNIYDEVLVYNTKAYSFQATLAYFFINNRLESGSYLFKVSHSNKTTVIVDYGDIKNNLIKTYGDPKKSETIWKDDLYKDDLNNLGLAISLGHVEIRNLWETPTTEIFLSLFGHEGEVLFALSYESLELQPIAETRKKALEKETHENHK
ncbi:MAG: hypothetical protein AB7I96_04900 [Candidatus Dadabacteria bacterium]